MTRRFLVVLAVALLGAGGGCMNEMLFYAPYERIILPGNEHAWKIDCGGGDCERQAAELCPRGFNVIARYGVSDGSTTVSNRIFGSTVISNTHARGHDNILVQCGAPPLKVENDTAWYARPAPPRPPPGGPDLTLCTSAFGHVEPLANAWVDAHPGREAADQLPTRDAFLRVCGPLPEVAQLCLNLAYAGDHAAACKVTLAELPTRQRQLLDHLFLAPAD